MLTQVFVLYSNLQAGKKSDSDVFRGLGHVDSRMDTLTVTFDLKAPRFVEDTVITPKTRGSRRHKKTSQKRKEQGKTVEIVLAQDKTALRSRKGDTGSVLWKARFGSHEETARSYRTALIRLCI